MIIVEDCLVTEDITDKYFRCDIGKCKGQCCVEGDAGAPLEEDEVALIKEILPQVKPYMTPEGVDVVDKNGVAVEFSDGNYCTTLIDNCECAFVCWQDGMALCAIERAFREGKVSFKKPISCHLYPIRVDDYGEFKSLNYHRWDVCECALCKDGDPLYKYLKEPLVRKFGLVWYKELVACCESFVNNKK